MRAPEDYRLTFGTPANCQPDQCTVFVGIDTNVDNPMFLDITMQGTAQGWVAVGFSSTPSMVNSSIIMIITKVL